MSPMIASHFLLKTVRGEDRRAAHGLSAHQMRDLGLSAGQALALASHAPSRTGWWERLWAKSGVVPFFQAMGSRPS